MIQKHSRKSKLAPACLARVNFPSKCLTTVNCWTISSQKPNCRGKIETIRSVGTKMRTRVNYRDHFCNLPNKQTLWYNLFYSWLNSHRYQMKQVKKLQMKTLIPNNKIWKSYSKIWLKHIFIENRSAISAWAREWPLEQKKTTPSTFAGKWNFWKVMIYAWAQEWPLEQSGKHKKIKITNFST